MIDSSGNRYKVVHGRAVPAREAQDWTRFAERRSWLARLLDML